MARGSWRRWWPAPAIIRRSVVPWPATTCAMPLGPSPCSWAGWPASAANMADRFTRVRLGWLAVAHNPAH